MKRASSLCVPVGAIPGALPPVIGWVAARGELSVDAWVLFAIMFLWQIPHTLAIAYLYREDFAKAGIQFLPVIEPDGDSTNRQILDPLRRAVSREPSADTRRSRRTELLRRGFSARCRLSCERRQARPYAYACGRAPTVVCVANLPSCSLAGDGFGPCADMNEQIMEPPEGIDMRNRRLGFALAILAVSYIIAVIVFIIMR